MGKKIMTVFCCLIVGFLSWELGVNIAMWRASQHQAYMAEQKRIEKEAAFIAEFEGLRIYAMPDGVIVEED
jgi:hypothetical protein